MADAHADALVEAMFDFDHASMPAPSSFPDDRRQSVSSASSAAPRGSDGARDVSPFSAASLSAYSALSPAHAASLAAAIGLAPPAPGPPGAGTVSPAALSLSPRQPAHSPPAFAAPALSAGSSSPDSSFVSDEYLLGAPFAPDQLDMLFLQGQGYGYGSAAPAQPDVKAEPDALSPFFLPPLHPVDPSDESFDLLKYVEGFIPNPAPAPTGQPSVQRTPSPGQPAQFDGFLAQWRGLAQGAANPAQFPMQQPSALPDAAAPAATAPAPRRSAPNAPLNKRPAVSPPPGTVGKHNKTERRYRAKVQLAQTDLRDAVPALRVLYGTSTPAQAATTDLRAADGTVDGLGEVTRPNASAKTTILIGAKMYIELLQRRTESLRRRVRELEEFRIAAGGADDLARWRADFDERERVIEARELERIRLAEEAADAAEDDDDDDDEPPPPAKRKRARAKKEPAADVRTFAAFAVSFSILPSLSSLLPRDAHATAAPAAGTALSSVQVAAALPRITAQHAARLLSAALPPAIAPRPDALIDWAARLLLAVLVVVALGPVMRWVRARSGKQRTGLWAFGADVAGAVTGRRGSVDPRWVATAAGIVGGATPSTPLLRHHAMAHLGRSSDPYALALLALLEPRLPFMPSPSAVWARARAMPTDGPLAAVLALPLDEARALLAAARPTPAPIAAIADALALAHVSDLCARLFVRLVDAATTARPPPASRAELCVGLARAGLGARLRASTFSAEARDALALAPPAGHAHALALAVVAVWGVLAGAAPSAQAALAAALVRAEPAASAAGIDSVRAALDLLYPRAGYARPPADAPPAARAGADAAALDALAGATIAFIGMLADADRPAQGPALVKQSARVRALLAQAAVGPRAGPPDRVQLDAESSDGSGDEGGRGARVDDDAAFEDARERLVGALVRVARREARVV